MAETHVIEVRAGRGEPPLLELRPGLELAPLSVGTGGAWQVHAGGVRAVHLYVYFDGQTLFVQSAAADDPPQLNGSPVPPAWTPAPVPSTITFGQARLAFHPAEADSAVEEDRTVASTMAADFLEHGPPAAARRDAPAPRPFKPGAFVSGAQDESTRLQPIEDFTGPPSGDSTRVAPLPVADPNARGAVRPAAGAPWNQPAPTPAMGAPAQGGFQSRQFPPPPPAGPPSDPMPPPPPSQLGPPGPPSGLLNVPPPSVRKPDEPEAFPAMLSRQWGAAPPLRRALVVAFPIALLIAVWLLVSGGNTGGDASQQKTAANPSSTASPQPSATTAPTATTPPPPPDPVAQVPTAWPPVEPPPPQPQPTAPTAKAPAGATAAAVSSAPPNSATSDAGNLDHRERMAADFVSTHAYDQAIRLYDQLAADHPQNPAFHEAARILRNKVAAGTP